MSIPCKAKRRDGRPCQAYSGGGSDFCFHHDPARSAERKAAKSKGGRARHKRVLTEAANNEGPVEIKDMTDVLKLLERAVRDVLKMEISLARSKALGYLANVAMKVLVLDDLEQRIKRLEAQNEFTNTTGQARTWQSGHQRSN